MRIVLILPALALLSACATSRPLPESKPLPLRPPSEVCAALPSLKARPDAQVPVSVAEWLAVDVAGYISELRGRLEAARRACS